MASQLGALATVAVAPDGTITVRCDCGDLAEEGAPGTEARRALQRLTSHVQLHATAAAQAVPWVEVRARRAELERLRAGVTEALRRDDDYGPAAGRLT